MGRLIFISKYSTKTVTINKFPINVTVQQVDRSDQPRIQYSKCIYDASGNTVVSDELIKSKVNANLYFRCVNGDVIPNFNPDYVMELKRLFNYIPIYDTNYDYIPEDTDTVEDLIARRKPVEMITFGEHQIPKAIFRKMKFFKHMQEDVGDITVAYPEHITAYVPDAMRKLHIPHREQYTIEDMVVYDFIGLLSLFDSKHYFIYGDELLEYKIANLVHAGIPDVRGYNFLFDQSDIDKKELITDAIVEAHYEYTYILDSLKHDIMGLGEYEYMAFRILKLIGTREHL